MLKKIRKNYLYNYLNNQLEVIILSAANYIVLIFGARILDTRQLGIFSLIYSFYLLCIGIYISSIGETMLIKRNNNFIENKQTINEILSILFVSFITIAFISTFLFIRFDVSYFDILIYTFSLINLILFTNNRYFNLSRGSNLHSFLKVLAYFLLIISLIAFIFILKIEISTGYVLFLLLGIPSFLINIISLNQINFDFYNNQNLLWDNTKFIINSLKLQLIIWCSGHLHWIIIGSVISIDLIGIIRACLSVVNPVFSIGRGMTIFFLKLLYKKNNYYTLKYTSIISFILSFSFLWIWLIFPEKILDLTIGIKYIEYKNIITLLFLIPPFGNSISIANSFLKYNNKFRPIYFSYIFTIIFLNLFILLNKNINFQPIQISLLILFTYILNFIFINFGLLMNKNKLIKN